jgi:hypothetical protein
MKQQLYRLANEAVRRNAIRAVMSAPLGHHVRIQEPTRTLDQNARMWAMLTEVSRAQPEGRQATPEVWKQLFMHACGHDVQFEMGLDGKPFPTGFKSSDLTIRQMSDLMEFIAAWASARGVVFTDHYGTTPEAVRAQREAA